MEEVFANIINFSNYQISNLGNVRNISTNKVLKPAPDKDGYLRVGLTKESKQRSFRVHRLVAEVFLENPNGYKQVDHIDRNPANNLFHNLRWVSHSENQINRGISSRNKSGIVGVFQRSGKGSWHAFICINGCKVRLGQFKNKDDAINARKQAEIIHYGAFVPIL